MPWLLVVSYVFYGWWNPRFLFLILYSTALDYLCVVAMDRAGRRGLWLTVSLLNNLGLLAFFKYADFVAENLNALLQLVGFGFSLPDPDILLPVGISFFTFQSMSYTIDYYRREIPRETSFLRFATYVAFFPQLVAGPIERARYLLPQLATPRPDYGVGCNGWNVTLSGWLVQEAGPSRLLGRLRRSDLFSTGQT